MWYDPGDPEIRMKKIIPCDTVRLRILDVQLGNRIDLLDWTSLLNVFELCGATRLGHFMRSQFYIALRLIAVAQCGLPVMIESLSAQNIPLPRFNIHRDMDGRLGGPMIRPTNQQHISEQEFNIRAGQQQMNPQHLNQLQQQYVQQQLYQQQQYQQKQQEYQFQQHQQQQQQYQQYQQQQHQRIVKGAGEAFVQGQLSQVDQTSKHHPSLQTSISVDAADLRSPPFSPQDLSPPNSPHEKVNGIARQMTTGHMQQSFATYDSGQPGQGAGLVQGPKIEKGWASFEDDSQALLSGSSATAVSQENKDWAHFTDSAGSASKADTSSISSEAESTDDVWTITDEQREYYVNQFRTMQSDIRGVISGAVAKEFFEKSRLPVSELSRIWQLSDVNRDGALSLEEFCTAMHLVVLRRNDIDLPQTLPPSLMPYVPFTNPEEPFASDLPPGGTMKKLATTSETSQQWGHQTFSQGASPTSSSVSSPGTKPTPVNFEFKPITADSDSQILHPVALRMSPDGQVTAVDGKTLSDSDVDVMQSSQNSTAFTNDLVDLGPSDAQPTIPVSGASSMHSRPRPLAKKAQTATGSTHDPQMSQPFLRPPPSSQESTVNERPTVLEVTAAMGDKPVPPPRSKGHSRNASLENQLLDFLDGDSKHVISVPDDADLIHLPDNEENSTKDSSNSGSRDGLDSLTRSSRMLPRHGSLDRRDVAALVRRHRDKNTILTRLNCELNQELQEVMEQRIALEIQLEHLKPYHS